jgi:hypothetical protein
MKAFTLRYKCVGRRVRTAPEVVAALRAPGKAVDDSGLDKSLAELL